MLSQKQADVNLTTAATVTWTIAAVVYLLELKYRINNLINNLVKIFLFDAAQAALHITLDVACYDLTFNETWLGKSKSDHHIVS